MGAALSLASARARHRRRRSPRPRRRYELYPQRTIFDQVAEAGLDSLAAVEVIDQLRAATGLDDLTPGMLLEAGGTMRSVAAHVIELADAHAEGVDDPDGRGRDDERARAARRGGRHAALIRQVPATMGSVSLGTAPLDPPLGGRLAVLLAAPGSGAEAFVASLAAAPHAVALELDLLPFATMGERSAALQIWLAPTRPA